MDIIIQSLGFKASTTLEVFIQAKLQHLKSDSVIRANVTLYKGPAGNPEADYCEIRLEVPGNDLFVKKHSAHFETSASECVEILSHQLKKAKEKDGNRQADASAIQNALMTDEMAEEDITIQDTTN